MEMGQRLKDGNTCTVQLVKWADQKIVVKRYNQKSFFYRLRHAFSMSRAMRSWANGIVMHQIEIPTARSLAVVEERQYGLPKRAYFVMGHFEGENVFNYLNSISESQGDFERVLSQLSKLFLRLKQLRAVHGDFKAKNILVSASNICLIDTDGLRFLVRRRKFYNEFRYDYQRLLANWREGSSIRCKLDNYISSIFES
tara:strand:- start:421 stop:1014 length:594 start_codon:yes stop_codon:yes gene_type:complete